MITYAFEQNLVPLIQAGHLCQTFRGPSLRHARPGERIRLTDRQNFLPVIEDPICTSVERCEISWERRRIHTIRLAGMPLVNHLTFARSLAFWSVEEMEEELARAFQPDYIEGFLISWESPRVLAEEVAA